MNFSQYPRINIVCNYEIERGHFVNCTFDLDCTDSSLIVDSINAKIKVRGSGRGWNAKSPKKEYRIELSEQKSLLGMRKDDDWQLFAMYYDLPRMRIKSSFDLWRDLKSINPTAILPNSEYVALFLNGEFQGLYLLAERTDRRLFELDDAQNNLNSSLIFQASFPWEQNWPDKNGEYYIMDEIMTELNSFIENSDNNTFFDPKIGIYSKFDKLNLIDFFLFNFFILHQDFWDFNYYIIRNTNPSKFFLVPWDFDYSFGQFGGSFRDPTLNPEIEIRDKNVLFTRLINNKEFMRDCKNRWFYLRKEYWTEDIILGMISDLYEEIEYIYKIEKTMWDPKMVEKDWENKMDKSVSYLFQWIPERIEFCDMYFKNF